MLYRYDEHWEYVAVEVVATMTVKQNHLEYADITSDMIQGICRLDDGEYVIVKVPKEDSNV